MITKKKWLTHVSSRHLLCPSKVCAVCLGGQKGPTHVSSKASSDLFASMEVYYLS